MLMRISEELGLGLTIEEELDLYELLLDDGFNEPHKVILNYMMRREIGDLLDEYFPRNDSGKTLG